MADPVQTSDREVSKLINHKHVPSKYTKPRITTTLILPEEMYNVHTDPGMDMANNRLTCDRHDCSKKSNFAV